MPHENDVVRFFMKPLDDLRSQPLRVGVQERCQAIAHEADGHDAVDVGTNAFWILLVTVGYAIWGVRAIQQRTDSLQKVAGRSGMVRRIFEGTIAVPAVMS